MSDEFKFEEGKTYTAGITVLIQVESRTATSKCHAVLSLQGLTAADAALFVKPSHRRNALVSATFLNGLEEARQKDTFMRFYIIELDEHRPLLVAAKAIDLIEFLGVEDVDFTEEVPTPTAATAAPAPAAPAAPAAQ